ncbi:peptidoglycan-associated lipoprotein Pal [Geomonas sp. Red69]|uniref:Peptidoglycan-associated lipoprotein n=1 Tax=Geomonas diazotrophica TaxID=2843197 RepID=A0ABX8JH48_9BACT|nr:MULTISPECIES: peptidoglycan-associated lipoprotein Pal [Geomonas]MBU5635223.1 peptidoglycan-associated lipoprotein Pal [Geomonas diazotrophica]QWV97718.1 peptidoglycan-associated lipoprotein Pal [Geomonas nitrogeniifigens]QXE86855.1 peptidoglycan-associated lipoprotein Pal [Geomonas nitrogeniifigens]
MKLNLKRLVPVLCTGVFIVSGCAKQQSVKTDQPLAPSATTQSAPAKAAAPATTQQTAPATSALPSSTIKSEQIQSQPAPLTQKEATLAGALEKVYFDFDSDVLSDAARKTLTENYAKLKAMPSVKIRIEGNCDERGSDEYNLALSERRAQSAMKYLVALGIPASRLSTIGYGEEKPAVAGHDEAAWAKNRRDEFTINK